MTMEKSARGFRRGEPVPSEYGGHVRVFESSAAMWPSVWLAVECPVDLNDRNGPVKEAVAHLRIEHAVALRDQLTELVEGHYQTGDADGLAALLAEVAASPTGRPEDDEEDDGE